MRLAVLHIGHEADAARVVRSLEGSYSACADGVSGSRPGLAFANPSRNSSNVARVVAFIFPLPGRSRTLCDRYCRFSGVKWTKAAANAQLKERHASDFFRSVFVVRSDNARALLFCWRRSRSLTAQKMVSTTVLFSDHDRNRTPTQAARQNFLPLDPSARANCQGGEIYADCLLRSGRSKHEFRQ